MARRQPRRGRVNEETEAEAHAERSFQEDAEAELKDRISELVGDRDDVPADWHGRVEAGISKLIGAAKDKGDEDRKTLDEVFDKSTLLTLFKFISNGLIETLDYPISTGKEANVFHATRPDGSSIAVKIFRVNTATFRSFMTYIEGDPRFRSVGRDRRDIVYTWAQKEYKNLERYFEAGCVVPQPIAYRNNVLLMEFIGEDGLPAPRLKDAPPEDPAAAFEFIVDDYARGFAEGGLAHGDLSEFNILNRAGELVVIDVAQAVLTRHPMATELLERDARNLARYFKRLGVKDATSERVINEVRAAKNKKEEALTEESPE